MVFSDNTRNNKKILKTEKIKNKRKKIISKLSLFCIYNYFKILFIFHNIFLIIS